MIINSAAAAGRPRSLPQEDSVRESIGTPGHYVRQPPPCQGRGLGETKRC